jgi:hypothetical protein
MTQARPVVTNIPVPRQLLRGERRPHIALVGLPRGGKSTLFQAASSTAVEAGCLEGSALPYATCRINVGLEQADLVDLPSVRTFHDLAEADRRVLLALVGGQPGKGGFKAPDLLIQVVDATALEPGLALSQELCELGKPLVIALNRLDEAREKGIYINVRRSPKPSACRWCPPSPTWARASPASSRPPSQPCARAPAPCPSRPAPTCARRWRPSTRSSGCRPWRPPSRCRAPCC